MIYEIIISDFTTGETHYCRADGDTTWDAFRKWSQRMSTANLMYEMQEHQMQIKVKER